MTYRIIVSSLNTQWMAIRAVRTEVFLVEQAIPPELEWDSDDFTCIHVVAWDKDVPVGTARLDLQQDGRLGRVCVLKEYRRRGIGSLMMQALEQHARENGISRIWFHSQVSAIPFYESMGYQAFGEEYLEAEIPHRSMEKLLGQDPSESVSI